MPAQKLLKTKLGRERIDELIGLVAVELKVLGHEASNDDRRVARELVEERIEEVADQLGITPDEVVRQYGPNLEPKIFAQAIFSGRRLQNGDDDGPPITITRKQAGRILASLGRIPVLATSPHSRTPAFRDKNRAENTLVLCGDAVSMLGLAIASAGTKGSVELDGFAQRSAKAALSSAVDLVRKGKWSMGDAETDEVIPYGMEEDAACLPA